MNKRMIISIVLLLIAVAPILIIAFSILFLNRLTSNSTELMLFCSILLSPISGAFLVGYLEKLNNEAKNN